ncbi:MAG: TMEM175 family protein [Calditrichia bacterium]
MKHDHSPSRLEAFSDAVFAFSATLLVVSLDVPDTFPALLEDLKGFIAFGLSFLALVLIWSIHRSFFRRYRMDDRTTTVLNSCLLFVILYYVYPLKFMCESFIQGFFPKKNTPPVFQSADDLALLFMLYGAGFIAIFICFALLYRHAANKEDISKKDRLDATFSSRHYGLFVLIGTLSITLAFFHVGLTFGFPGIIYAILGPVCQIHAMLFYKKQR